MGNTFTNLVTDVVKTLDIVSREIVGLIPSVQLDASSDSIAKGETIRIPLVPQNSAGGDITPAMSIPSAADQTITNRTHSLTKFRYFPFSWNGEETFSLPGSALSIQQQQIAQAFRAATAEMSADIYSAIRKSASRAYGTAGSTPFASTLAGPANVGKILTDNGAPNSDRQLVIDTTAGVNLRTLAHLNQVNTAGTDATLRRGILLDLAGFEIREDAKVLAVTKGTATGALVNGALAAGATSIVFDTATAGATGILTGDVITFAGDTNKYVVTSGVNGASGTLTIAAPGLINAVADNAAITVGNDFTANCAFTRSAVLLSTRLPKPTDGDLRTDSQVVQDPISGISFEIVKWPGADMVTHHVRVVWGVTTIKPEHTAIMLG